MVKIFFQTLIFFLFACLLVTSCVTKTEQETAGAFRISQNNRKSSCPYFTKDQQGNPVLCWVEAQDNPNDYLLHFAVSTNGGKSFSPPRAIPTTKGIYPHDENLSKMLFKENGDIMAMFAVSNPNPENSYAGLVFYTQSFDGGKKWTVPRQLAQNTQNSIDERYFDITLLPDGEIAAVWLDSRKDTKEEGSSLYYARTQGRGGFVEEKVIDKQLCQCCRTDLYVEESGKLHVAYRAIINGTIRDMAHMVSEDNGKNFSKPERISADNWVISGCPHTGPTMASNKKGMHFAWYTMGGGSGVYYNHKPDGQPYSARQLISNMGSAKHPQMISLSNEQLVVVWDEQVAATGNTHNWIGLQTFDVNGNFINSTHITPDSLTATHPVLLPVNDSKVLVSYTTKSEQNSEVWYQMVDLLKLNKK